MTAEEREVRHLTTLCRSPTQQIACVLALWLREHGTVRCYFVEDPMSLGKMLACTVVLHVWGSANRCVQPCPAWATAGILPGSSAVLCLCAGVVVAVVARPALRMDGCVFPAQVGCMWDEGGFGLAVLWGSTLLAGGCILSQLCLPLQEHQDVYVRALSQQRQRAWLCVTSASSGHAASGTAPLFCAACARI